MLPSLITNDFIRVSVRLEQLLNEEKSTEEGTPQFVSQLSLRETVRGGATKIYDMDDYSTLVPEKSAPVARRRL